MENILLGQDLWSWCPKCPTWGWNLCKALQEITWEGNLDTSPWGCQGRANTEKTSNSWVMLPRAAGAGGGKGEWGMAALGGQFSATEKLHSGDPGPGSAWGEEEGHRKSPLGPGAGMPPGDFFFLSRLHVQGAAQLGAWTQDREIKTWAQRKNWTLNQPSPPSACLGNFWWRLVGTQQQKQKCPVVWPHDK